MASTRRALRVVRRDPLRAGLLGVVWMLLIAMRGAVRLFELKTITRWLGSAGRETPADGVDASQLRWARRVSSAIGSAAPHTPTNSNCYPQALTAHVLLRACRVPSTFYYGAKFATDELETHVWVRVGSLVVTGAPVHRAFAPLSAVASCSPSTTEFRPGGR